MFRLFTLNAIISIIRFTILLFVFYLFPLFFVYLSTFMPSVGFSWYSIQIYLLGSSLQCVAETYLTSIHEDVGLIPGLLSGSGIRHCCEPRCRSQTGLRSQASSCSCDSTPSLGTSMCHVWGPKKLINYLLDFCLYFSIMFSVAYLGIISISLSYPYNLLKIILLQF